jgi:hypothetical protein
MLLLLGGLVALLALVIVKATWTPVAPLRVGSRRRWGQLLSASGRMYVARPRLFVGLGLFLIPVMVLITVLQWLLRVGIDAVSTVTGSGAGLFAYLAVVIGTTLTLLAFGLVQGATACALVELDAGRAIGAVEAYRLSVRKLRPLLRAIGIFVLRGSSSRRRASSSRRNLARRALVAARPVVELEEHGRAAPGGAELVRGRWLVSARSSGWAGSWRSPPACCSGAPDLVSNSSLALLNLVSGVVYAVTLPFVALVTAYVYFDARAREELEPRDVVDELPAEITLGRA